MRILVDTNILVRILEPTSPLHDVAVESIAKLREEGEFVYILPQNLVEFWAIATRPRDANGLGFDTESANVQIDLIKLHFTLLPENEVIFENWEKLVVDHHVIGKTTHDARIVAAMMANDLDTILTFNVSDFRRYAAHVNVLSPADVIGSDS